MAFWAQYSRYSLIAGTCFICNFVCKSCANLVFAQNKWCMETQYSITLDKRRKKTSSNKKGKYPVKLRIYNPTLSKAKLYSLGIDLTEEHYQKLYFPAEKQRLSDELKKVKIKLDYFEKRASEEIEKLDRFTFENFERHFFRDRNSANSVQYYYSEKINRLKDIGKIGTAESYQCSINSIKNFIESRNRKIESLRFPEVDAKWLKDYESYMLRNGKTKTTIGIYLRPLSALFNQAIEEKDLSREYYPFGKNKYKIPKGGGVKKALSQSQLKSFYESKPRIPQQEKAKDFWFLSYCLNGMNIHDILLLKNKNLKSDRIEYVRNKTKDTNQKTKTITTYLNELSVEIISKYRASSNQPNDLVFPVLERDMTPAEEKKKVKIFTRFINQHIKNIARENDLPVELSTYWARHTFATTSVNNGASLEFMSEALGHGDLKTTQAYFAGFANETKKEFAASLLGFRTTKESETRT